MGRDEELTDSVGGSGINQIPEYLSNSWHRLRRSGVTDQAENMMRLAETHGENKSINTFICFIVVVKCFSPAPN